MLDSNSVKYAVKYKATNKRVQFSTDIMIPIKLLTEGGLPAEYKMNR